MKRILALLTVVLLLSAAAPLRAQESVENELERVRKLRLKGWGDLAKIKIEELLKRNDPILNAELPLEQARINIAMARQLDPEQRFALFTLARSQLQDFIKQNQGKPEAALASVESARVTSYHAQAILSRAMREQGTRSRQEKARPAEAKFIEAGQDLEAAIKAIDAALPKTANPSVKALLTREQKQARFDLAINLFDQAKTYIDISNFTVNAARSTTMGKAIEAFKVLRSDESSEVGWLANAWLMKCSIEITAPGDVKKYHKSIMDRQYDKSAQPAIQPALRLVRFFAMQDMTLPRPDEPETIGNHSLANPKVKMSHIDHLHAVQKEGEAWLKAYPNYLRTYEGQGVRYELAHAYMAEAFAEKDAKLARTLFANAGEHFKKLSEYDGDLAERARQLHISIEFKNVTEGKMELRTFDQFYMKAMIERQAVIGLSQKIDELSQKIDPKKPTEQKKIEDDIKKHLGVRKKHLKEVIVVLSKALAIADSTTPIQKVDDARYYLTGAYWVYGDPYRAAVVAEALGRGRTTRRSPEGASTAIQTYSALQTLHPDDASIRRRLNDMIDFVLAQTAWEGDPVMSLANYHMGMTCKREGNVKKAIAHLEKLPPDFVDYSYTQGQLAFIAISAIETASTKKEQKFYIDAAKAAIKRMPMYSVKDDSPTVITMYYYAKLEMSKFMYSEAMEDSNAPNGELKAIKKLNEMSKYVGDLQNQIGTLPGKVISEENRDQIEFTMQIMQKFVNLGLADVKFRSDSKDRFDQVIKATKPIVDDVIKRGKATKGDITMKDYRVTADILSLALRANVQKGNIKEGQAILAVLNRLTDKGKPPGNVVAVLLNDIAAQIRAIKKDGDTKLFKETRESYTLFLDDIAKEYDGKPVDINATIMLAHAYSSLEFPSKAAPLFAKIKPPASLDTVFKKKTGKEPDKELEARAQIEEENGRYWAIQIEYIRALRACKEKESRKTAEAACKTLLDHPNAKFKLQAMMEKNFLIEDQERYREAYIEWQKFLKNPSLINRLADKDVQKIYFPGYFHCTRLLFKMANYDKGIKNKQQFIEAAAKMIIKLETAKTKEGWEIAEPLFREMFKDKEFEILKREYERQKALQLPLKGSWLDHPRPWFLAERAAIGAPIASQNDRALPRLALAWRHPSAKRILQDDCA